MKHEFHTRPQCGGDVAPHVGAWVETSINKPKKNNHYVAPHVGAWVETSTPLK